MVNDELCVLVDGNNILLRAHHAFKRANLQSPQGQETGALFGTINTHINLVRSLRPTRMVWFFDAGGSKFRKELYPEYKANRKNKEDIRYQYSAFEKFLSLVGVRFYREQGVEADDLLATAILRGDWDPEVPKVIVSADHDLWQLVSNEPRVSVLKMKQGNNPQKIFTYKSVKEEFGMEPKDLPNLWALTGDSSDNIKGVPGVGPKTALKLMKEYGTLEEALRKAPKLKGYDELVYRNLQLIQLTPDKASLPVQFDETYFPGLDYDSELLQTFFEGWGMNSLRLKEKGIRIYG